MGELALDGAVYAGHVMAQVAACHSAVGLSVHAEPTVFELRGGQGALATIGGTLKVSDPSAERSTETSWGWWRWVKPCRALLLADPSYRSLLDDLMTRCVSPCLDVSFGNVSDAYAAVVLAGPRAGRLARSAVVELVDPVLIASSGEDYWVLVVHHRRASSTHRGLLEAGARDGAVSVEPQATNLYRAGHRISGQHADQTLQQATEITRTGVQLS